MADDQTDQPAKLEPPYIRFNGSVYPWTDEMTNREMLMATQMLGAEGIEVAEGVPTWAFVIAKLFVAAKRIGAPLTMAEILDGQIVEFVGPEVEDDAGPPAGAANGLADGRAATPGRGGRRTSASRSGSSRGR